MSRQSRQGLRFQPAGGTRQKGPAAGQKQVLSIERLAHDGRGIAFVDGRSWFVSGALPQELVRVRVLAARSKVVDAIAEEVRQASPQRIEPFCPLAGVCGGCTLQHMPLEQQRRLKQEYLAEQLQRNGVLAEQWEQPLLAGDRGYRRRTRLSLRVDKTGCVQLGYRALASREIVNIRQCPILVPELQAVLPQLTDFVGAMQQPQAIGHLELLFGNTVAVLVRLIRPVTDVWQQAWRDFCNKTGLQLWWQTGAEPFPDQPGSRLAYHLADQALDIDCRPGDFVQVNAALNQQMVNRALGWLGVQPTDRVLDLFCGLGNFSLPLAQQAAEVVAVEGVTAMVERARRSAAVQKLDNLHFYAADLSQSLADRHWASEPFDLIVLDPPRDGAMQITSQLARFAARKILYVSCNPATLARDAALLSKQGYQLVRVCSLDMFSHTSHVEAMALFVKPHS